MRIIFVEMLRGDTAEKVLDVMTGLGFSKDPRDFLLEFGEYVRVDMDRKQFLYRRDARSIPLDAEITTLDELLQRAIPKPIKPGPSYEWLEKQCTTLKKQLSALGYEDRGEGMMAPPIGKTPEYILNDLTPEQAIQAFKDGKSVTVAGKPMTSGTTVEELLDSRLTLKHKRFGRIVLTDQVTAPPKNGTTVFISNSGGSFSNVIYETGRLGALEAGCLHYTEQGAIDHAEEMVRLNRDGFVEMDVEWLVKLKTISHAIGEEHFSTAANKVATLIEEVSKKMGEF